MKTLFCSFAIDEKSCNLSGVVLLCNSPKKIEFISREKRRNQSGDSGGSAVVSEVISCAYVGYFPFMASQPFGGRKPTGITNGARITPTAVRLANEAGKN